VEERIASIELDALVVVERNARDNIFPVKGESRFTLHLK